MIKDSGLRKQVDAALTQAEIEPINSSSGCRLSIGDQLPVIGSKLTVVSVKSGAKSRLLKLTIDKTGELFLSTKVDLTGYEIRITRSNKVLKKLSID